jgi:hypothetical protein
MSTGTDVANWFFEELCNQRRLDIADEIFTTDHRSFDPNVPSPASAPNAMVEVVKVCQNGVEGHWAVQEIVDGGAKVTVRWVGGGTHTGEVPPRARRQDRRERHGVGHSRVPAADRRGSGAVVGDPDLTVPTRLQVR